jgi:hypothetical protein
MVQGQAGSFLNLLKVRLFASEHGNRALIQRPAREVESVR